MALILITGRPCTGKSLVVARIADELRVPPHTRHVHVVNDAASTTFTRAHTYDDSHTERAHRAYLRSLVQQHVSKNTIVIVDALNYIKGYRYELFCAGKLAQCMYCVVTVDAPDELADQLNDSRPECSRYPPPVLAALRYRFEPPDPAVRWDSPLFRVINNELLDKPAHALLIPLDDIVAAVTKGTALAAHRSTDTVPLAPTSFVKQLDTVTNDIVQAIYKQQRDYGESDEMSVPYTDETVTNRGGARTMAQLARIRRQYIAYTKAHTIDEDRIASTFVNFVNHNV